MVSLRASFSTAFRPPNLIQVNQPYVTRTGTREDAVQKYRIFIREGSQVNSGGGFADDYTISNTLHYRLGNSNLEPEESDNATLGIVCNCN